jgi:hypothetical protein
MAVTTLIGLVRDFIAAALGLAILFGAGFSDEQVAGILLLVSTALALGTWAYGQWKAKQEGATKA